MDRVLVLTDGKAGHENQSRAFVRALGRDFDSKSIFGAPSTRPSPTFSTISASTPPACSP